MEMLLRSFLENPPATKLTQIEGSLDSKAAVTLRFTNTCIWPFSQVLSKELLNPLEFPEIGVAFVIYNEPLSITSEFMLRQLKVGLRMGLVIRKTKRLEG